MELAKAELTELKKEVVEAMEGQLKRYLFNSYYITICLGCTPDHSSGCYWKARNR